MDNFYRWKGMYLVTSLQGVGCLRRTLKVFVSVEFVSYEMIDRTRFGKGRG